MDSPPLSYAQIVPGAELRRFVETFWVLRNRDETRGVRQHLVFPDGGTDLVFAGEPFLSGIASACRRESLAAGSFLAGVRLRPGALGSLFGISGKDLRDRAVSLADIDPPAACAAQWGDVFRSPEEALRGLASWLTARVRGAPSIDPVVSAAVQAIESRRGAIRLAEIEALGIGSRRLRRKFDSLVGLSPKRFCRVLRLNHAADLARATPDPDWADIAAAAGYYDQAHFIQEFAELAGTTPGRYFAQCPPVRFFQYDALPQS